MKLIFVSILSLTAVALGTPSVDYYRDQTCTAGEFTWAPVVNSGDCVTVARPYSFAGIRINASPTARLDFFVGAGCVGTPVTYTQANCLAKCVRRSFATHAHRLPVDFSYGSARLYYP